MATDSSATGRVVSILIERGLLTPQQGDEVAAEARRSGKKIGAVLLERGLLTPRDLAQVMGDILNVPVIDPATHKIDPAALRLVPENVARQMNVLPIAADATTLTIALEDPLRLDVIDNLRTLTHRRIVTFLAPQGSIEPALDEHYRLTAQIEKPLAHARPRPRSRIVESDLQSDFASASTIQGVDTLIEQALRDRASDIHLEPARDHLRVRFRIDGILHDVFSLPLSAHGPFVSHIKMLANMDISERRRPRSGRFAKDIGDRDIHIRVDTVETGSGEMLVLHILDRQISVIPLAELGMLPVPLALYQRMLETPLGMLLVAGPRGSGKTTTLYASLQHLDTQELNIMTIEDPIEYHFDRVNQIQVNRQSSLTFASALRAIMRLDPDVILIGEISDAETAAAAVEAALGGHRVLATIHASDAASAAIRLRDLGVEPFLLSSVLVGSIAQRLVRRVCPRCGSPRPATPAETALYAECLGEERSEFVYGAGCDFCAHTGYFGRIGLFEVLPISDSIRSLIATNAGAEKIRRQALHEGMIPLRTDGMLKVQAGVTTPYEVIRNTFTLGDSVVFPPRS